jgi:hypothetical protein
MFLINFKYILLITVAFKILTVEIGARPHGLVTIVFPPSTLVFRVYYLPMVPLVLWYRWFCISCDCVRVTPPRGRSIFGN